MLGSQCCKNPPTLSSSSGNGSVLELGGFNTYVSGPSTSKLAILLVSDVYGYEAPNLRTIADKVAAAGYYVVVPDFFFGDPYNEEKSLSPWFELHKPDKGFEDAKQVAAALKDKGISAIGAAGFCWGEVKPPVAILAAEIDHFCPPERIKQYEEILLSKPEVDKFVKIYPSVKHGWTVRYNVEDKKAVQRAEEAHRDMLDWLTKHVKYSEKGSGFSSVRGPRSSM
ncbi:endo-1,3;1,4-beta-D-glucanase-like isoform X4 [Lycium ferocissimum]|uniref:endo-1,3;1,4-beta-D-glucanase-like isoform X4 n=1 Tax=Lycium ferocissimum TaxID=112874 RepID=UPI0028169003|nr:endo-1,3;1,4-beta-D-glucanase-like isoform X4 [Lycium ferocissimum]